MSALWLALAIIAVVLLGTIIFILGWTTYLSQQSNYQVSIVPISSPVEQLYRCTNFTCDPGLACDSVSGLCKLENGQACRNASQCLNGAICSGVCVTGTPAVYTDQADDPCPCPETMICFSKTSGSQELSCKLVAGEVCQGDNQCYSDNCVNGKCSNGVPDGQPCVANNQCIAGSQCSLNYCQPNGITTGQTGAVCDAPPGGPVCNLGISCINNVCGQPDSGLGLSCNVTSNPAQETSCGPPLTCRSVANNNPCLSTDAACYCQFNFTSISNRYRPDPNSCPVTGQCGSQYVCNNSICLADKDAPCTISANCNSNSCNTNGAIFQANFTYFVSGTGVVTSNSPIASLGSYDIVWTRVTTAAIPANVKRITATAATSIGISDILYYVIAGNSINPTKTGLFTAAGVQLIPGYFTQTTTVGTTVTIDEFTLIDCVMFGTISGLVAFTQNRNVTVNGGTPTITQNDVLYSSSGITPTTIKLTPYNVVIGSGLDGTQYTASSPLTIGWIDRSNRGDVLIQDRSTVTVVYVKPNGTTGYNKATTGGTSPTTLSNVTIPKFYFDTSGVSYQNISYVQKDNLYGFILQFTGTLLGAEFPLYPVTSGAPDKYNVSEQTIYSDPVNGTSGGVITLIARNQTDNIANVFIAPSGSLQPIIGYANESSRLTSTSNLYNTSGAGSLYLYSNGVCL